MEKGEFMEQALFITGAGMGGVFAFLLLLIGAMKVLSFFAQEKNNLDKVAVAIAAARRGQ